MGVKQYVKKVWRNNTNISEWTSWKSVTANADAVKNLMKGLGEISEPGGYQADSFEAMVKHYGLSEAVLKKRMKFHYIAAIFSLTLGLAAFGWFIYIAFFKGMFLSGLVAFSLSSLMFSYAFREHMFYFRIKQRKINCTIQEWLKGFFPSKRSS